MKIHPEFLINIILADYDGTYHLGIYGDQLKLVSTESGEGPLITSGELYEVLFTGRTHLSQDEDRLIVLKSLDYCP